MGREEGELLGDGFLVERHTALLETVNPPGGLRSRFAASDQPSGRVAIGQPSGRVAINHRSGKASHEGEGLSRGLKRTRRDDRPSLVAVRTPTSAIILLKPRFSASSLTWLRCARRHPL